MVEPSEAGPARLVVDDDAVGAAAALLAAAITRADARRAGAGARLAIPGGSALAVAVAARALVADDVWRRVRLTWVDERRVDAADPESNYGSAKRAGLFSGGAPGKTLRLVLDGEPAAKAVSRAIFGLAADFEGALDVVLLGMGPDGHVASLFPGRPAARAAVEYVPDAPKPPPERLTLTRAVLLMASETILLATGATKRAALAGVLAGDAALPAVGLPGLVVVTDQAGILPRGGNPA